MNGLCVCLVVVRVRGKIVIDVYRASPCFPVGGQGCGVFHIVWVWYTYVVVCVDITADV